jgi:hypothetical protein
MNYKNVIKDIDSQIKQLEEARRVLVMISTGKARGTRRMSAAGRARIAKAQRARWARLRAGKK